MPGLLYVYLSASKKTDHVSSNYFSIPEYFL